MAKEKDYLSEFEQEWNAEYETADTAENEFETDDEFESGPEDEFETGEELEPGSEEEFESSANGFEERIYNILRGDHENELEFEQQMNEVLHEMEKDYFWGSLKKKWNRFKKSGLFATLKKLADQSPFGDALKQVTALARGDMKGMIKNLAGQALAAAGPGGLVAKKFLNLETDISGSDPRKNAQLVHETARKAYGNLAEEISKLPASGNPGTVRVLAKSAFEKARNFNQQSRNGRNVHVSIRSNDILIVRVKR